MLQDILENFTKKITIKLRLDHLAAPQIESMQALLQDHPGDLALHFSLYDMEESTKLDFISRKQKVGISNELIQALEAEEIHYSLN